MKEQLDAGMKYVDFYCFKITFIIVVALQMREGYVSMVTKREL